MIISICDNENNSKMIKISGKEKIKDLKLNLTENEEFDLYFNGKLLNPEKLLTDYGINSYSTIEKKNILKGGLIKNFEFADITKQSQTKKLECYNKKFLCPWRIVRKGLNLEGKCLNKNCDAYKKIVIINKKFGKFDILNEKNYCPICNNLIEAKTCGFSGCTFCISGKKIGKNDKIVNINGFGEWEDVKEKCYVRFDTKICEIVNWESLTIYTKELL